MAQANTAQASSSPQDPGGFARISPCAAAGAALARLEVCLRPISAGDLRLTTAFVARLSERSRYLRFFSTRRISGEELRRFTDLDASREGALIAVAREGGEELQVGVARFVDFEEAGDAEFAIVVGDDWQGRGVARALMCALIDAARRHGARRLVGSALSENSAMLGLARAFGFRTWREAGSASVTFLALDLQGPSVH